METSDKNVWPEKNVWFISRIYFAYFWRLILKGWKQKLTLKDLWTVHRCEEASAVHKTLMKNYEKAKQSKKKRSGWIFAKAILRTHWQLIALSLFAVCVYDLMGFLIVLDVKWLIELVTNPEEPRWHGAAYVVVLFVAQMITGLCWQHKAHGLMKIGVRIRSAAASMVFEKALRLSPASRRQYSGGEITNLATVDAGQFMEHWESLHYVWSAPVLICLGSYLLHSVVGHAFWIGMLPLIISTAINGITGRFYEKYYARQMTHKDDRLRLLAEVLRIMQVAKLFAWEPAFQRFLEKIRAKEISMTKKIYYLHGIGNLTWFSTSLMSCIVVFATYAIAMGHPLTPVVAFTVVTVFAFYLRQLVLLPQCIFGISAISASFRRLSGFLSAEEITSYAQKSDIKEGTAVSMDSASFSWDSPGATTLEPFTQHFQQGELTAIVGSVGSGKSSVLNAISGEMYLVSGRVKVAGTLAYVPQQSWILNDTVRGNILFNQPYDEERYRRVIRACALEPDLEILAAGDMTEIGERGVNLSGGQKQRISLARAVYQNRDIYLLDDPLSAVDVHVQAHLFNNVIGPKGVLKEKTRLLVTNALAYLQQCDRILIMEDGKVAVSGTYQEIAENQSMYILEAAKERKMSVLKEQPEKTETRKSEELSADHGKLTEEEVATEGKVSWGSYWLYCSAGGWAFFIAIIATTFAFICNTLAFIWLQKWTDRLETIRPNSSRDAAVDQNAEKVFFGLLGIQIAFGIIYLFAFARFAARAAGILHGSLLKNVMRCPLLFFTVTPMGRILNRFGSDINTIDNRIPVTVTYTIQFGICLLLAAVPSIYATPALSAFLLVAIIIAFGFQKLYIVSKRQFQRLQALSQSPVFSRLHDMLQGPENVRIYQQQTIFLTTFYKFLNLSSGATMCNLTSGRWLSVNMDIIANLVATGAALLALLSPGISPGLVGLSVSAIITIVDFLLLTVQQTCDTETAMVSVERVNEYLQLGSEAPWSRPPDDNGDYDDSASTKVRRRRRRTLPKVTSSKAKTLIRGAFHKTEEAEYSLLKNESTRHPPVQYGSMQLIAKPPQNVGLGDTRRWPTSGVVEFVDYSLKYRPDLPYALKNITLHVGAGEKVGVVGRTGAGKTSLVAALFRLVEPSNGKILIDNIDICTMGLHDLRRNLTIIPQDPALFSGTIRQNLDPFSEYADDEVWRVLSLAHLKNYVASQSDGLEFHVDDGGSNLSVGQRQLLCLARALLKKSKILVLDEATAFVDLETDKLIQSAIRTQFADCTVITIAHRLETIIDYDSVVILSDGQILEHGRIKHLLSKENSEFHRMVTKARIPVP